MDLLICLLRKLKNWPISFTTFQSYFTKRTIMENLDYFKKFVPVKESTIVTNPEVWSYTRVSSKEQFDNNSSITRQQEANLDCAAKNNFRIIEQFGGTYESAKSDFTRKEFKRLIEKVKSSRKKPYAILVYKMSRFSRSGGNAIGLVSYLVDELKVHLYEVCSGLNTTTDRGKAAIWDSLFSAFKENLERKEIIIPNMAAYIKAGNWFSKAPRGYDHFGPKVRNIKFHSPIQKIVINDEGKILREAWKWKLSGLHSDVKIAEKLANRGLLIEHKRLSEMWRNPFYCGIGINKLVEGPTKGKWEPIISQADFIKVQQILDKNTSGYQHKKDVDERPLTRLLRCNSCDSYMVGYKNNKKNLHYYRCLKCTGVNLNAHATPHAKKKSAETIFLELLEKYQVPKKIVPVVEKQLTKLFKHYNENNNSLDEQLENQFNSLQKEMKDLKIRLGLGKIDKETYDLTFEHLNEQIVKVNKELNNGKVKISNLESVLKTALNKLEKLSKIWGSGELEDKRTLQKTLFPDGIFYDAKNNQYLTRNTNKFIELVACLSMNCEDIKKEDNQNLIEKSSFVLGNGIEPSLALLRTGF